MKTKPFILLSCALLICLQGTFTQVCAQQTVIHPKFDTAHFEISCIHYEHDHPYAASVPILTSKGKIKANRMNREWWQLKGMGKTGKAHFQRSEEKGIWWDIEWAGTTCTLLVTPYNQDDNDPRLLQMDFAGQTWYIHNGEPDMNSLWILSLSKDPLDESKHIAILQDQENEFTGGAWRVSPFKINVPDPVRIAFFLAGITGMNLRYDNCFKDAGV